MKITDLIERLQEIAENHPYLEVLVATQPSYPMAHEVTGVTGPDEMEMEADDQYVWLCSPGRPENRSPYAPTDVFETAY